MTVSMYNVGFGDCFLLRFPAEDGRERKMLIDCGSIKRPTVGGQVVPIEDVVQHIIADVTDDGEARIDVVAITHRHEDHVSGFLDSAWGDVRVDEVWMPWTEDPNDPEAVRLLQEMSSFAVALSQEFHTLNGLNALGDEERDFIAHVIENFFGESPSGQIDQDPMLSLKNDAAMTTLHRGFKGGSQGAAREFLRRLPAGQPHRTDALPGVDVHVLGPSDDESALTAMDPPHEESFLHAVSPTSSPEDRVQLPFPEWEPPSDFAGRPDEKIFELLKRLSSSSALLGAAALESAVNNTSLMLAFEIGDAVLLFPGDSQWGSWQLSRDDSQHMDLLRRCTFYKVGHHGSHNASPRFFLEDKRLTNLWGAAISVTPHGSYTRIPKQELLDHLNNKLGGGPAAPRLVRSDRPPAAGAVPDGVQVVDELRVDFKVPIRTNGG
ncbi:MAG TPA: hypothetical protein VM848_19710 [Acidimicrobiia bacterium]|nr:hypothetical protein [Acidimicrobiia bacterium]